MINPMEEATRICVKVGLLLLSGEKDKKIKRDMMGAE
jgi:hypothetical protein